MYPLVYPSQPLSAAQASALRSACELEPGAGRRRGLVLAFAPSSKPGHAHLTPYSLRYANAKVGASGFQARHGTASLSFGERPSTACEPPTGPLALLALLAAQILDTQLPGARVGPDGCSSASAKAAKSTPCPDSAYGAVSAAAPTAPLSSALTRRERHRPLVQRAQDL